MKAFKHHKPNCIEEAISILREYKDRARPIAGGTDLLGALKDRVHPAYPEALVDLKAISGLAGIEETAEGLSIGAMTRVADLENHPIVQDRYPVLAQAAKAVASPQIRNMATVAGNICQEPRCWYYRNPDNTFHCLRKGGQVCNALAGENRYHSIFGAAHVADPPCTSHCPAGTDISAYMEKIRAGQIAEAASLLLRFNPFAAITGRVCPHFCQEGCNRGRYDEAVQIRGVERFLGDYILEHFADLVSAPPAETGARVAVIGSGPAGLSAAFHLRMSGHGVVVYDRLESAGGMMAHAIPAYRLPREVVRRTIAAVARTGVEFRLGVQVGKDVTLSHLEKEFDGLFLAAGAWGRPAIGVEGEGLCVSALDFLTRPASGEKQTVGERVVVIGGGNVAVDAAMTALRRGAGQVILACLECREEMPALAWELAQAVEEGVQLMPSWGPGRILSQNGKVTGIELVRCVSVFDDQCRFAPVLDGTTLLVKEADQVILAVGQRTDLSVLNGQDAVETLRDQVTVQLETQATSHSRIWAGGDMASGPATIVSAIASGRRAAMAMDRHLKRLGEDGPEAAFHTHGRLKRFNPSFLGRTAAVRMPEAPPAQRTLDREDAHGLSIEAARGEADRCLNCGCVAASPSDLAVALIALDAQIITTRRTIVAERFFVPRLGRSTLLDDDELVTEIRIPPLQGKTRQCFMKFRIRKSIDFPIASVAVAFGLKDARAVDARIVLGAAAPAPLRAMAAEAVLNGRSPDRQVAEAAAEAAVQGVIPLSCNSYKTQIFKALVKRGIVSG